VREFKALYSDLVKKQLTSKSLMGTLQVSRVLFEFKRNNPNASNSL
jgi:hypothetical protein